MVETRRRQIEDVASELFHDQGYAATGVRDIARALDIQGASLYSHVTSKEAVLWAIVERTARTFENAADRALDTTRGWTPSGRLRALVLAHIEVVTSSPKAATVFDREWRHLDRPRRDEMRMRRDAYAARFRELIEVGIARGEFAPVDPSIAAAFLLTALNAVPTWYQPGGPCSSREIADACADLSLRSLTGERA
jgi:TetR/AcrR family transcriptional regulator, cholesterol catabolism regulator